MNSGGLTGGKQGLNQEGKVKGPPPVGRIWLRGKRNFGAAKAPLAVARRRKVKNINVPGDVARTEPALRALKTLNTPLPATASFAAVVPNFVSPANAISRRDSRAFILPSYSPSSWELISNSEYAHLPGQNRKHAVAKKELFCPKWRNGTPRESAMKTMSAREAKNAFGLMIDTARAQPVLIEKHGRGVVVVVAVEEYERLSVGHTHGQVQPDSASAAKV